jgi:hypothetical protein
VDIWGEILPNSRHLDSVSMMMVMMVTEGHTRDGLDSLKAFGMGDGSYPSLPQR